MIAALLLAGLSAIALGAALVFVHARAFQAGLLTQAVGAAAVGLAGFWALGSGDTFGAGFASALDPRFGVDGLSGLFLGTLGLVAATGASLLAPLPAADTAGTPGCRPERRFRARAGARPLRPRPAHLPDRLGADDAALGDGDPRLAPGRPALSADGLQLPRRHPSRRGRHLGRSAAARAGGRVRRLGRDRGRLGAADRDRTCRSRRDGNEGRA